MPARVYSIDVAKTEELKKFVEYDPYLDKNLKEEDLDKIRNDEMANVIVARQTYKIKEGALFDLDRNKVYLYISASDEFLEKLDKKLKSSFEGIERVEPESERKIIATIEDEQAKGESGFGFIFG